MILCRQYEQFEKPVCLSLILSGMDLSCTSLSLPSSWQITTDHLQVRNVVLILVVLAVFWQLLFLARLLF